MLISPPGKGRRPAPIHYGQPRALTEADIASMWDATNSGQRGAPRIKTLRYNHHLLAKAVASGKTLLECSQLCGLTVYRISDLKNDPAFQELVSFYAEELNEVYVDVHQRMAALGTSVLEELQERFEEEPDKFTKRELMELFTTMADRSIPTAKGGPSPQPGLSVGPGGNGLALQINFVSPPTGDPETLDAKVISGQLQPSAPPTPSQTQAPAALTGSFPSLPTGLMIDSVERARSPLADELGFPPGIDIDGEPFVPHTPIPAPSHDEIQQARFDATGEAIARREAEAAERDRLRAEYMAQRLKPRGT
jgi:hypothetical protein